MTHTNEQHLHLPDPPQSITWTEERTATVKEKWLAGYSASIIADEIGLSRNSVISKVRRMGLQGRVQGTPPPHNMYRKASRVGDGPLVQRLNRRKGVAPEPYLCQPLPDLQPLHISLDGLTGKTCHWPFGDSPFTFCGHEPLSNLPYCAAHCRVAYQPPKQRAN